MHKDSPLVQGDHFMRGKGAKLNVVTTDKNLWGGHAIMTSIRRASFAFNLPAPAMRSSTR